MKNKNIVKTLGIFLVLSVFLSTFVLGFGVSSPYWEDNPMTISPGETKTAKLNLQNMVGNEDINVNADITQGSEIASVSKSEYFVKLGTKDTVVPVEVSIPSETPIGTEYKVTLSIRKITSGGEGVVFGLASDTTFDVLVVSAELEETKGFNTMYAIYLVLLLLVIVLITILLRKKASKPVNKKRK